MTAPPPDCDEALNARAIRAPTAHELLISCVAKRSVTNREGHTRLALAGHPCPASPRGGAGLFDRTPVQAKRSRHPCRLSSPPHRRTGPPDKAARPPGAHSVCHRCAVTSTEQRKSRVTRNNRTLRMAQFGQLRPFTSGGFASYICSSRVIVVSRSATVGL